MNEDNQFLNASILTYVKKLIGIDESYMQFDMDIISAINLALTNLFQIAVGDAARPYAIVGKAETWADLLKYLDSQTTYSNISCMPYVMNYVWLKASLLFDPPTSSILKDVKLEELNELSWRLGMQEETVNIESGVL